jgi:hypothetical protein
MMVADDFVVDVYVNGQQLPQGQRHLKAEIFGAQVEQDEVELHAGDWVVFNVASNGLRWNGSSYFAAAALADDGSVAFNTETDSHRWSACDAVGDVPRFLAEPTFGADRPTVRPAHVWGDGDKIIRKRVPGWAGAPVWGTSHSCWIKYVVPRAAPAAAAPADKGGDPPP